MYQYAFQGCVGRTSIKSCCLVHLNEIYIRKVESMCVLKYSSMYVCTKIQQQVCVY